MVTLAQFFAGGYRGLAWLLTAGRMHWRQRGELIPLAEVGRQVDLALAKSKADGDLRMAAR